MTTHPLHPLAITIAKAILATVEADRCCNLENIAEAVFRELAVDAATKMLNQPVGDKPDEGEAAQALLKLMNALGREQQPLGGWSIRLCDASREAYAVLSKRGMM